MKPIPVAFHLGPLVIHTYGVGLAITFYVAYKYFEKRLRDHSINYEWLAPTFVWVIAFAIIGARLVHVIANFTTLYEHNLIGIIEIWNGGLSSYGGLIGGFSVGIYKLRKAKLQVSYAVMFDLCAPVLVAAWALGRLLGPQLMVAGGGRRTNAWYGMYYADQAGKRLPVPIFQAIECFIIFLILLALEKKIFDKGPAGAVALLAVILWNISRFFDEFLYLDRPSRLWNAVEAGSVFLIAVACVAFYVIYRNWMANGRPAPKRYLNEDSVQAIESAVSQS